MACHCGLRVDDPTGSMEDAGDSCFDGVVVSLIRVDSRGEEMERKNTGNSFKELCSEELWRNGVIVGRENGVNKRGQSEDKRKALTCWTEVS